MMGMGQLSQHFIKVCVCVAGGYHWVLLHPPDFSLLMPSFGHH